LLVPKINLKQTGEQSDHKEQELGPSIESSKTWHNPIGFPSFERILVAYDGMQMSKGALSYAAYISKISDSEIVVVNVTEHTRDLDNVLPVTIKTNLQGKEEQIDISGNKRSVQLDEALREVIKETTAVCRAAGMTKDIIYEIREGNPADEIINVSTLMDFDLIVMGSRRIASAIEGIGSTTRKVAATVKIPLLIVQKQPRYKDEW
jgi:nucleotide-binding universal stress UspA family protein